MSLSIVILAQHGTQSSPSVVINPVEGLTALANLPAGSSPNNPIDVDNLSATETDTGAHFYDLCRPGDSIDNPIDLDALPTGTNNSTEPIVRVSSPASSAQTVLTPDGRSIEEWSVCKVCYAKAANMVLGCGHAFCYDCINEFFHSDVLKVAGGSQELAYECLASGSYKTDCFFCKRPLSGYYADRRNRARPEDTSKYFPLSCQKPSCQGPGRPHCFIKDYMMEMKEIKMP